MSRRAVGAGASLALVLSGLVMLTATSATAEAPSGSELATALDAPAGVTASVSSSTDPLAYAVTDVAFNDFPSRPRSSVSPYALQGNSSYVLLSTGLAADVFRAGVTDDQPSTDLGATGPDTTTLKLDVAASATPRCLLVDFAMGTEERVHTYDGEVVPGDTLSVKREGDGTEWAMNAGDAYITQIGQSADKIHPATSYDVNDINYWHTPGDASDPLHGTAESPRLPKISAIDSFTTRDTAEVPLPAGSAQTVNVSVADVGNGRLDTVAQVDRVRLASSCSFPVAGPTPETSMVPDTGVATGSGAIVGHRGVGNVLTLDPVASTTDIEEKYDEPANGWFPAPVELRFRWYKSRAAGASSACYSTDINNWLPLRDGDRQSYVPTNLEKNYCLMVLVTGKKDGFRTETFPTAGQGWYVTLPIQNGAFDGQPPVIPCDQTPAVGSKLSANVVPFVPRPDSYEYQWYAGSTAISGATAKDVILSADEAGKVITVRVTAKRSGFDPRTETSAGCGPVTLRTMSTTPRPIIVGDGGMEHELSIETGAWDPPSPTFGYQWRLDNQNITNATRATYTPKASDVGHQVTVAVTGAKTGFQPVTQVSDPITVGVGQLTSGAVLVSGTPVVAGRLTGTTSGWSTGTSLTFIWSAGSMVLQEGTSRTLTVPAAAVGRPITLTVRGDKVGYGQTSRTSAPTAPVASGTLKTSTPRISGTAKVGRTLKVSASGWGPAGVRFNYRWTVNGKYVGTKSSVKVKKSWKGKRIRVRVTGTLPGYTTVAKDSGKTAKVKK